MIDNLEIRICREEDIDSLERAIPTGENRYHLQRFRNQQNGKSTYLVAFSNNQPVGHLDLIWKSGGHETKSEYLKNSPELNAIV